jgi:hypothetical protein
MVMRSTLGGGLPRGPKRRPAAIVAAIRARVRKRTGRPLWAARFAMFEVARVNGQSDVT